MKTNSDSCGSRAAYGYPPKQASAAHSRSAECFCQRLQHSHFTTLEVMVLRLASAKPDRVCGAEMRRSGAEGRSPEAISKRYASTRARASIIGVYQPFILDSSVECLTQRRREAESAENARNLANTMNYASNLLEAKHHLKGETTNCSGHCDKTTNLQFLSILCLSAPLREKKFAPYCRF